MGGRSRRRDRRGFAVCFDIDSHRHASQCYVDLTRLQAACVTLTRADCSATKCSVEVVRSRPVTTNPSEHRLVLCCPSLPCRSIHCGDIDVFTTNDWPVEELAG